MRFKAVLGWIKLAAAMAWVGYAGNAIAYCRTTTTCDACVDDPTPTCPSAGPPLHWSSSCVSFSVQQDASKRADFDTVERYAKAAFGSWQMASCPGNGGNPSITIADAFGPAVCHRHEYNIGQGNANIIILYDSNFPFPETPDALAVTTVLFSTDTGEIFDADMEIDMSQPISVSDSIVAGSYDLLSIMTHESGHFLGVAHSMVEGSVMQPRYMPGTSLRTLGPTDDAVICAIYPPNQPLGACDFTPRYGFSPDCLMATNYASGCSVAGPIAPRPAGPDGWWFALFPLLGLGGMTLRRLAVRSPKRMQA
jgi:hypothetical protein